MRCTKMCSASIAFSSGSFSKSVGLTQPTFLLSVAVPAIFFGFERGVIGYHVARLENLMFDRVFVKFFCFF